VQVLLSLDEGSYDAGGGAMGDHPISWYHGHAGGRSFYTALGHTKESWAEAAFVEHVAGGITWAAGVDDPRIVVAELDGVADSGVWDAHDYAGGSFSYDVGPEALVMHDAGGGNQHLVRRGVLVDASRPYAVEALFRVHGSASSSPENSFCLNLGIAGADGDTAPPSTWAMNLDVSTDPPSGVMKHMGFVDGAFVEIGQTPVDWAGFDTEYLLRVAVNADETGAFAPALVTTTVLEAGVLREQFSVDYSGYPYQPPAAQPVRIGANTHGTDWTMRGLRVYYLDGPAER
jgi:hypothetical protein